MQTGRRALGHTLIELIVSVALMVYLMMMVAWGLVYCNSYLRNCETKAESQTQTLSALIWMSRSLTESNVTATSSVFDTAAGIYGVSFVSPRDPGDGSVNWDSGSGSILWKQQIYAYLAPGLSGTNLVTKGFPLNEAGGVTSVPTPGGYPPGAPNWPCIDPPTLLSLPSIASIISTDAVYTKTVAPNIRSLQVDIYNPAQPGSPTDPNWANTIATVPGVLNTANITIEGFAPYYGLNYGVMVNTQIRITN